MSGAGTDGRRGEIAVEDRAIDDGGADALGVDHDRGAVWRDEARGIRGSDNRSSRKAELVERVEAEDAGAVHGRADDVVFLEDADAKPSRSQFARSDESGRAAPDHDHIAIDPV